MEELYKLRSDMDKKACKEYLKWSLEAFKVIYGKETNKEIQTQFEEEAKMLLMTCPSQDSLEAMTEAYKATVEAGRLCGRDAAWKTFDYLVSRMDVDKDGKVCYKKDVGYSN